MVKRSFLPILVCSLAFGQGCTRLAANSGAPQQSLSWVSAPGSGTFNFSASGYAFEINELANNPDRATKKTTQSVAISGSFAATPSHDKVDFSFQLTSSSPQQSTNEGSPPEPPKTTEWRVSCLVYDSKIYPKFKSDRLLNGEELFATRCLLSYWMPFAPPGGEWTHQELDGNYGMKTVPTASPTEGRYEWVSASDTLPGLEELPSRIGIPVVRKVSGELLVSLGVDAEGIGTRSSHGRRLLKSHWADKVVAESELGIDIRFVQKAPPAPTKPDPSFEYELSPVSDTQKNEIELQKKFLKGANLAAILASIPTTPLETKKRNERFLQLRALFFLYPDQADNAVSTQLNPEQLSLVAEALVGSGKADALDAFADLLSAYRNDPRYEGLVSLVVPITNFGSKLEAELFKAAFTKPYTSSRYNLQLVVGSNIRRCLDANPSQANRLSDWLVEAIRSTTSADDKVNLLYAFGNAGNVKCIPTQAQFLGDSNANIRAAAAHSYRHFPIPILKDMLDKLDLQEKDPLVKEEIQTLRKLIMEKQQ